MATNTATPSANQLGAQAIAQAAVGAAIGALVEAVRALPSPPTHPRTTPTWWERLLGLGSEEQRWAKRWAKACARVDHAADHLHRVHAELEARLRATAHPMQRNALQDGVGHLAAPTVAQTSAFLDAQAQALLARTARVLDEALPFWEQSTGMRGAGGAHAPLADVRATFLGKLS
jgi:hypothetical protein